MIRPATPTPGDPIRAKYSYDPDATHSVTQMFSTFDECILGIEGTPALFATMTADVDVDRICAEADLDNALTGGERTTVQTALENRNIPAQWVTDPITWRQVIRTIVGMFQLNKMLTQRMFWKKMLDDIHAWLQGGGLSNVVGFEAEPPATTTKELNRQGRIVKGLQWQQLPIGVQNYLIAVRDEQGWSNAELGLTTTSTVLEIMKGMSGQHKGIKRRLVRHGLTLNSTWADFPQGMKDELRVAVEAFGLDPVALGFSGTTTLRQMLKTFADEFAARPLQFNNVIV